jgi:hypothetical protein
VQKRTCLELKQGGEKVWGKGAGWKNDPNNVCMCEQMNKKNKNKKNRFG